MNKSVDKVLFEEYLNASAERKLEIEEILYDRNNRLVHHYLRKCGIYNDDNVQWGSMGLIEAIRRFDVTKGTKFSSYAVLWIRQYVSRAHIQTSNLIRIPDHMYKKVNYAIIDPTFKFTDDNDGNLMDLFEDDTDLDFAIVNNEELEILKTKLRAFLATLQERDRLIFKLKNLNELTQVEISDILGISRQRISQRLQIMNVQLEEFKKNYKEAV